MSTKIPILSVYDENGNRIEIPAIKGDSGEKGDSYILSATDLQEIAEIANGLMKTETWTFTLESGSTVTKQVVVK